MYSQKVPKATTNTRYVNTKGLISSTRSVVFKEMPINIMFTSDAHGESLSIATNDVQITVAFEKIMKLVEETRRFKKEN